jgi:hypothetical protein
MSNQKMGGAGVVPLKFKVAPHIVQDLGLNLYTSLPRVLVEFVANAYDADAEHVVITLDKAQIDQARKTTKAQFDLDKVSGTTGTPLDERVLPQNLTIEIIDDGIGMSRQELQEKFLVAGRRRREMDGKALSDGGRILMGRKGLGKLAGFGVAQVVTVTSKKADEKTATKIEMDYRELIKVKDTNEIAVPTEDLADGGDIGEHGTKVVLSRLMYEPMKSRLATIENEIADHFANIDPADCEVKLNNDVIVATPREHDFAWPQPQLPINELVEHTYETEQGQSVSFKYRLRFTKRGAALNAIDRGIRIYAHKRLAAAPSLLQANTNMHGFRMTDYLDGVAYADFIDDQPADYIATDRQSLRWDTPLLSPMLAFLSDEIKEGCKQAQAKREREAPDEVRDDAFTSSLIKGAELSKRDTDMAYRVAEIFASKLKKGIEGDDYKQQLPLFVNAIGQRDILKAMSDLAKHERPELSELVIQVSKLADSELDDALKYVKAHLDAIRAFQKICEHQDFKKGENEGELHELFERSPWLINPTFNQFLTSDRQMPTMLTKLAEELKVGKFAGSIDKTDEKRPDLVFLLGNEGLHRVVIVELKSPNLPLVSKHVDQLLGYMRKVRKFLEQQGKKVEIEGILIGMFAPANSTAEGVEALRERMEQEQNHGEWKVFSILQLLELAERAHQDLLKAAAYDAATQIAKK